MKITVVQKTSWTDVVNAARMTVHKAAIDHEPSDRFKNQILLAEHSPIRELIFNVTLEQVPYFVVMHLVRHHSGTNWFVATSREDRTGVPREERRQTDLVDVSFSLNAQAYMTISRKRLCSCASKETRDVWKKVLDETSRLDPILVSKCRRECVYRSFCPEMSCCGYDKTEAFKREVEEYRRMD